MRYLHKVFHEKSFSEHHQIFNQRFKSETAVHVGLQIKPMDQPNVYDLYYLPTNKMLELTEKIQVTSRQFNNIFNNLPMVAQKQFLEECLMEELYQTNTLEGVKSTRKEIAESIKDVTQFKNTDKRFGSMVKTYLTLLNDDYQLPTKPQDIREIYDKITGGEIAKEELPDGEIFRKDTTFILKQSGSGKVIHQGITPERSIIKEMEILLSFMNESNHIPKAIKVLIGHYYFGYIHPFYDGNGRTSRFISSLYLAEVLGNYAALSLSRGCSKHMKKYLDAFEKTNSIKSRGELNYFIETLLEIIDDSLYGMIDDLKEKYQLLEQAIQKLENDENLTEQDKTIMFILIQNYYFDSIKGMTIKELASIMEKSEVTIRKIIKPLLEATLVEQSGQRPAYYSMSQRYLEG